MAATANAAFAIGEGARAGRIQPGFDADFTVFDTADHRHIPYHYGHNHALMTVVGGRVVHDRGEVRACV
jgi:imidazolonepropionase